MRRGLGIFVGVTLLGLFNISLGHAEVKNVEYFYTVPYELSGSDGWAYQVPECTALSNKTTALLKDCEKLPDQRVCYSKETIKVSNVATEQTVTVPLVYHIFPTQGTCVSDRTAMFEDGE